VPTHKFHLGQAVEFNPPRGIYAPRGAYLVTAKLPERDGVFEYRVRSASEEHERTALENELSAITVEDKPAFEHTGHQRQVHAQPKRGTKPKR
jgi:hypothetical protein